jgi:hypothetical protein
MNLFLYIMSSIKIPGFTAKSSLNISSHNPFQWLNSFTDDIRAFVSLEYWPIPTPSDDQYSFQCCCENKKQGLTICFGCECPIECVHSCSCNNDGHPECDCRCERGGTGEPGPIIFSYLTVIITVSKVFIIIYFINLNQFSWDYK